MFIFLFVIGVKFGLVMVGRLDWYILEFKSFVGEGRLWLIGVVLRYSMVRCGLVLDFLYFCNRFLIVWILCLMKLFV